MNKLITLIPNETESLIYLAKKDKKLAKLFISVGTITYQPHKDEYAFLITTIIGQMLSNRVASILRKRLLDLCKGKITVNKINGLTDEQIKNIGISKPKILFIRTLTDAIKSEILQLENLKRLEDQEVIKQLTSLKGIGPWSAKMYLIFVLNRQNVLPYEDGAFLQAYSLLYRTKNLSAEAIKKKCHKWEPYSSIAARYLYRALDSNIIKNTIF